MSSAALVLLRVNLVLFRELGYAVGVIPSDLVSYSEAAAVAGVVVRTIERAARAGRLRRWGSAGRFRVSLSEVLPEVGPSPAGRVRKKGISSGLVRPRAAA